MADRQVFTCPAFQGTFRQHPNPRAAKAAWVGSAWPPSTARGTEHSPGAHASARAASAAVAASPSPSPTLQLSPPAPHGPALQGAAGRGAHTRPWCVPSPRAGAAVDVRPPSADHRLGEVRSSIRKKLHYLGTSQPPPETTITKKKKKKKTTSTGSSPVNRRRARRVLPKPGSAGSRAAPSTPAQLGRPHASPRAPRRSGNFCSRGPARRPLRSPPGPRPPPAGPPPTPAHPAAPASGGGGGGSGRSSQPPAAGGGERATQGGSERASERGRGRRARGRGRSAARTLGPRSCRCRRRLPPPLAGESPPGPLLSPPMQPAMNAQRRLAYPEVKHPSASGIRIGAGPGSERMEKKNKKRKASLQRPPRPPGSPQPRKEPSPAEDYTGPPDWSDR
nr:basic proline-rich protein-like [Oryctolagus cuniculus]